MSAAMDLTPEEKLARKRAIGREKNARWRAANPEKVKEVERKYREAHFGKVSAKASAYQKANRAAANERVKRFKERHPERVAAYKKAWREANLEAVRKQARDHARERYAADPERFRAEAAAWREANPRVAAAMRAARRAALRNAEGSHTAAEIRALMKAQNGKCAYCRISIKAHFHADHIKPLVRGGSNWIRNIQLLCQPCNQKKHAKDPIDFAQERGMLL